MIKLENISRVYTRKQSNEDIIALNNISITLPEKGFISVLGASGSGKTTLLNIIGGLDKATSGNMIVDGLSTNEFSQKQWDAYRNEKIGFVLQNCYLLPHLSIKDNVALKLQISSKKKELNIEELVDNSLKEVGLYERRNDKPKSLSGGQKQRVAIARAIVGSPTVILADEPTGALDSKTGNQIMSLLKKLSQNHLVIMVTHNKEYAQTYSQRIIELKDGEIISDTSPINETKNNNKKELGKISFPWLTSLKWGFKNIISKKLSTLSIVIASALGLAGVGLILSISKGVETAFKETEEKSISEYPVYISSYSPSSPQGSAPQYDKFTDLEEVYADLSSYATQEHFNFMSNDFLAYMDEMDPSLYYVRSDSSSTVFNIYTQVNESIYRKISSTSSLFYKGVDKEDFINKEYDCLKGKYPVNEDEVALVVDTYNRVDGNYLALLGFDVDTSYYHEKKFTFDEILNKTYHYVNNDDYYVYNEEQGRYVVDIKTAKEFYDSSTYELKIVGILREKPDSGNPLFRTGIIYTPKFEKKVIKEANESQIVIDQLNYGYDKNVLTGLPIVDQEGGSYTYKASYIYENLLYNLGQFERITTIYYYTQTFEARDAISRYFRNYVKNEEVDFTTLTYNDYLERMTTQFNGALSLMTTVLYVFSGISVLVAMILNAILTYISIHQRTNEIGLLRSLGARKKDVAVMIETESLITGILGGILSVILAAILVNPTNEIIKGAIYQYNFYLLSRTTFTLSGFQWWVSPILIIAAILTSLISALIPASIAAKKDPAKAINE